MSQHIHRFSTEEEYNSHKAGGCSPCVALVEDKNNNWGLVESFTFSGNSGPQFNGQYIDSSITFYYACTNVPNIGGQYWSGSTLAVFTTTKEKTTKVLGVDITGDTNNVEWLSAGTGVNDCIGFKYFCESDNGTIWVIETFQYDPSIIGFPLMLRTESRNPSTGDTAYFITDPYADEEQFLYFGYGGRGLSYNVPFTTPDYRDRVMYGLAFSCANKGVNTGYSWQADMEWFMIKNFTNGDGGRVYYENQTKKNKYYDMPLTIEVTRDGYLYIDSRAIGQTPYWGNNNPASWLYYSINGTEWQSIYTNQQYTSNNYIHPIWLEAGAKVEFKGGTMTYGKYHEDGTYPDCESHNWTDVLSYPLFNNGGTSPTLRFKVYGNIMSLTENTNWENNTPEERFYFGGIFADNWQITDASNLVLPSMHLYAECYAGMFTGCINLTKAPKLPATELAPQCYKYMFAGCGSLKKAPKLPARVMAVGCYQGMFQGCTSLTEAPELPATALADYCYGGYYQGMFAGCTGITSAPELPATTLAEWCYEEMFQNCYSMQSIANLPARVLPKGCYARMFQHCHSLYYIKCCALFGIDENYSTSNWLYGVRTGTGGIFYKDWYAQWPTGPNGTAGFIVSPFN